MSKRCPQPGTPDRGRFSANRATDAVLRLLRGKDREALSRKLGVTAATLSSWRDAFLRGGRASLKSRPATTGTRRSPGCAPRSASCAVQGHGWRPVQGHG